MVTIRELRDEDIPAILSINKQSPFFRISPEEIKKFEELKEGICIVAEESNHVIGFLLLLLAEKRASILDVETDIDHLGTEVTAQLIETARKIAIKNGVTTFYKTTNFFQTSQKPSL